LGTLVKHRRFLHRWQASILSISGTNLPQGEAVLVRKDSPIKSIQEDGVVCLSGTATTYTVALKISERK
jgi:hypothetical protein